MWLCHFMSIIREPGNNIKKVFLCQNLIEKLLDFIANFITRTLLMEESGSNISNIVLLRTLNMCYLIIIDFMLQHITKSRLFVWRFHFPLRVFSFPLSSLSSLHSIQQFRLVSWNVHVMHQRRSGDWPHVHQQRMDIITISNALVDSAGRETRKRD